jgi:hypothetical protein
MSCSVIPRDELMPSIYLIVPAATVLARLKPRLTSDVTPRPSPAELSYKGQTSMTCWGRLVVACLGLGFMAASVCLIGYNDFLVFLTLSSEVKINQSNA